jgi:hypothetical protein
LFAFTQVRGVECAELAWCKLTLMHRRSGRAHCTPCSRGVEAAFFAASLLAFQQRAADDRAAMNSTS